MSEPQTEYETEQETDAEPTPGPWTNGHGGNPKASETCKVKQANVSAGGAVADVNMARPKKENLANARLIAAAGTAAQDAKEMGYDPVAAVEALSGLLHNLGALAEINARWRNAESDDPQDMPEEDHEGISTRMEALLQTVNALKSAEGSEE